MHQNIADRGKGRKKGLPLCYESRGRPFKSQSIRSLSLRVPPKGNHNLWEGGFISNQMHGCLGTRMALRIMLPICIQFTLIRNAWQKLWPVAELELVRAFCLQSMASLVPQILDSFHKQILPIIPTHLRCESEMDRYYVVQYCTSHMVSLSCSYSL